MEPPKLIHFCFCFFILSPGLRLKYTKWEFKYFTLLVCVHRSTCQWCMSMYRGWDQRMPMSCFVASGFIPLRKDFCQNLELDWQPSNPESLLISTPSFQWGSEAKGAWPCLDFYMDAGDLNWGLHTCIASARTYWDISLTPRVATSKQVSPMSSYFRDRKKSLFMEEG